MYSYSLNCCVYDNNNFFMVRISFILRLYKLCKNNIAFFALALDGLNFKENSVAKNKNKKNLHNTLQVEVVHRLLVLN